MKMMKLGILGAADRAVEKRASIDQADEGFRKAGSAPMIRNPSAAGRRAIGFGNRNRSRPRPIFPLHACKCDRNAGCIGADSWAYD